MRVSKKEAQTIRKALEHWQAEGDLSQEEAQRLATSFEGTASRFDWQALSYYTFMLAVFSALIAVIIFLADDWLWKLFDQALNTPDSIKSLFFALLSFSLYALARKRRLRKPQQTYSNEALLLLGAIGTAVAIGYMARSLLIDESAYFTPLILLATGIYGCLALWFPSRLLWGITLITLGIWAGTETGYWAHWDRHFLGMNYPVRFSIFGILLLAGSYFARPITGFSAFYGLTLFFGLLYLFVSLWLLSIFGNMAYLETWWEVPQRKFWPWSVLLLAVSGIAMLYGLRTRQSLPRDVAVTFLFINLYTRYVEYGWDTLHRAIFFTVLAISFWLIGRFAERIWTGLNKSNPG
ncbi:MAG TPA: DUF2157 domain-containing protein [Cytophagales bacterium]|nr:DUF2157 domain-containing protein [Cytophagales bacterium]HAA20008.1 DUF2157 domain-containing protein [Cytophagales bacterium]